MVDRELLDSLCRELAKLDDLKPVALPFSYGGKDYVLKEANGDVATRCRNIELKSQRLHEGKVVQIDGIAESDMALVQGCVFERMTVTSQGGQQVRERPVAMATVRAWPYPMLRPLIKTAKAISDLASPPDTVEDLDEQIARLQRRRQELESSNGEDVAPKGESASTGDGSGSPTSSRSTSTSVSAGTGRPPTASS